MDIMDMETLTIVDLKNSYNDFKDSYNKVINESSENAITIFVTSLEDKVLIDTDTLNYIVYLLQNIYANNLALLFIMSCLSSIYVCTHNRRKKDFVILNNVEPKLLKGELIEKV
jgi:hypothetical protein